MMKYLESAATHLHISNVDDISLGQLFFRKTSLKLSACLMGIVPILLLVSLFFGASSLLISLGCCFVPAFFTFQALQSQQTDDDKKYLTYWIVYAFSEVFCPVLSMILQKEIYLALRIASTVLLLHPKFNYSLAVYEKLLEPQLVKYEDRIDTGLNEIYKKGKKEIVHQLTETLNKID